MFPSAKPKVVVKKSKPKSKTKRKIETNEKPDVLHRTVEPEWMATYWEQEALWDYYIPEDKEIKFIDGKYVVPITVYRHNEDMLNTKRRAER